jgi:hypothetical protein
MAADGVVIGAATLSMTQALALFQNFLPRFSDIRSANPEIDAGIVRDVRMGELAAVLMTLGVGAMTSSLTDSPIPAVIALITSGGMVILYESALADRSANNAN